MLLCLYIFFLNLGLLVDVLSLPEPLQLNKKISYKNNVQRAYHYFPINIAVTKQFEDTTALGLPLVVSSRSTVLLFNI